MTVTFQVVPNFDQLPVAEATRILYEHMLPACERQGVKLIPEGHDLEGRRYEVLKGDRGIFDVERVQRAFRAVDAIYQPASQYREVSKPLFEKHPLGGYVNGGELMAAMMLKGYSARFAKQGKGFHFRAEFKVKPAKEKRDREIILDAQPMPVVSLSSVVIGAADWERLGKVEVAPLPSDMEALFNGPCPIWPGKRFHETHCLFWVPSTVGGVPLTLNRFIELVQPLFPPALVNERPFSFTARGIREYFQQSRLPVHPVHWSSDEIRRRYGEVAVPASRWVLMTKDVLEGTKNKSDAEQKAILARYPGYEVPQVLDVVICILMEYLKNGTLLYAPKDTGRKIGFHRCPQTFTRCKEPELIAGDLTDQGVSICSADQDLHGPIGLGASRYLSY